MAYTLNCASENLDERRYRELVLQILDTINTGGVTPATRTLNITPNDGANLSETVDWIQVSTSGTVKFDTEGGTTSTQGLTTGQIVYARITKVYATDTTATGIVGYIIT